MSYIGRISYGLYLYHYVVFVAIGLQHADGDLQHPLLRYALGVALTFVIAAISFRLIEQPLLRIKDRFT